MAIKLLLADDHEIILEGLHTLLSKEPDLEVVGEVKDGRQAVKAAQELEPDIVIMDITMPSLNGIEATRQMVEDLPDIKILVLSMHMGREYVAEALEAGASGYLLKDCAFQELIKAIRAVSNGKVYLSQEITSLVVDDYVHKLSNMKDVKRDTLTSREREVLQLIAEGKSTKQIADLLFLSPKTIETYRSRLKNKLNMDSIADLTKYALREGLTSLD
ncbi:MAG TPA: response regulator transcription factor [bacterium]|nr:response regulator transcription factor [bacterium]